LRLVVWAFDMVVVASLELVQAVQQRCRHAVRRLRVFAAALRHVRSLDGDVHGMLLTSPKNRATAINARARFVLGDRQRRPGV